MSERLNTALDAAANAETAFERAKASAKVWHAFFLDIELASRNEGQRQRERNAVRAGVHPYTAPIISPNGPEREAMRARANGDRTFWRQVNDEPPEPWSPSFLRHRTGSPPPDLDLEIAKTMRECSDRVLVKMQSQQLGEDFKNLPYGGPERRRR